MSQTVTWIFESCLENRLVENWVLADNAPQLLTLKSDEYDVLKSNGGLVLLASVNILPPFLAQVIKLLDWHKIPRKYSAYFWKCL